MPVIAPVDLEPLFFRDIGNNNDPAVVALIARAQEAVEGALGRKIESESGIVERHDGQRSAIFLTRWPVTAITSISEDGNPALGTGDYFFYEGGVVYRLAGGFASSWRSWQQAGVTVTYTAGFPTTHVGFKALAGVVLALAGRMFEAAATDASKPDGTDAVDSESIGSYQVNYRSASALPGQVESVANAFRLSEQELETIGRWRIPALA